MKSLILLIALLLAVAIPSFAAENLLSAVDQASIDDNSGSPWETTIWSGNNGFDVVEEGRDGDKCLYLTASPPGSNIGWVHPIDLEPNTEYRLSAWVKTDNVETTGRHK